MSLHTAHALSHTYVASATLEWYRTDRLQIKYLADLAAKDLKARGKEPTGGRPWVWEQGRAAHTAGIGKMYHIVGRRADV